MPVTYMYSRYFFTYDHPLIVGISDSQSVRDVPFDFMETLYRDTRIVTTKSVGQRMVNNKYSASTTSSSVVHGQISSVKSQHARN